MAFALRCLPLVLAGFAAAARADEPPAPAPMATQASAPALPRDVVIPDLAALGRPDQHYALYLPPDWTPDRRWPLLVILDPRGRAERIALAVDGARRHGWMVMASYQSRSDTLESVTLLALQALLEDAERRFSPDPRRLYLAGMSGTAKSLWTVADPLRGRLAGMIGCAGGRDPGLPPLAPGAPAFYGCTGDHDFNHREMLQLDAALAAAGLPHRLERFAGGHGWMPRFDAAIDWLQRQAMRAGLAPPDPGWIAARYAAEYAAAEAAPDDYLRWLALSELQADYAPWVADDGLAARVQALSRSPGVRAAREQEEALAHDEQRYQQIVNAWAGRMRARFPDGRPQDPPPRGESLNALKIRGLRALAQDPDRRLADSAQRRLELAYAAAHAYLPAESRARGEGAQERAALQVAASIFPEREAPAP